MVNISSNFMDEGMPTDSTESTLMKIVLTPDEEGYIGRECPSCEQYFKVKFGTGLPTTSQICPYCGHKDDGNKFFTKDQIEYIESFVANTFFAPVLEDLRKSLNSLSHFKPTNSHFTFPLKPYQEKLLETDVICDNCGLNFSIIGVFSDCPDCGQLNAKVIFNESIEGLTKKLELSEDEDLTPKFKYELQKDALIGGVSAFDALGKPLRAKYNNIIPASMPKNLFQDLGKLNKVLHDKRGKYIADYISQDNFEFLYKMFQVRHIYDHNAGVIDEDFIKNMSRYDRSYQLGRKYPLTMEEIEKFLHIVQDLGTKIFYEFEENHKQ